MVLKMNLLKICSSLKEVRKDGTVRYAVLDSDTLKKERIFYETEKGSSPGYTGRTFIGFVKNLSFKSEVYPLQ